jgi:2'-5' RNA ligase
MALTNAPVYHVQNCIAIPLLDDRSKTQLKKLGFACLDNWKSNVKADGQGFQVTTKGHHITLGSFLATSNEHAEKVSQAVQSVVAREFQKFTVKPHFDGVRLFIGDGNKPSKFTKDYVVCPMMVDDDGGNSEHKVLMALNRRIIEVVKEHGGQMVRPDFIPHATLGKIQPAGITPKDLVWPAVGGKVTVSPITVDPKTIFAFKPTPLSTPISKTVVVDGATDALTVQKTKTKGSQRTITVAPAPSVKKKGVLCALKDRVCALFKRIRDFFVRTFVHPVSNFFAKRKVTKTSPQTVAV